MIKEQSKIILLHADLAGAAREAATWAAGCKQGRDDVIAVMPMLVAAHDAGGGVCGQHGAQEAIEHA
jgi:hypothetical protein